MSKLRYLTSGESHGQGLTVIVEGIPADLIISENYIEKHMARRQKGYGSGGRMKIEKDKALIKSGVRHGKTLGSPIALWIENKDFANWNEAMSIEEVSDDVDKKVFTKVVPGHADFPGALKYNQNDLRNILERASARETASRVAAGSIARKFLEHFGISIHSRVISVGSKKSKKLNYENIDWEFIENSDVRANDPDSETKFKEEIDLAKSQRTTVGGIFQVITYGVPVGLGSHVHWDRKLDGQIGQSILSINAVKGVEIGNGFENTTKKGKDVHDVIIPDKNNIKNFKHISNHADVLKLAMEEATFLTRFAKKVTIVHRRDVFRASKVMYERAVNHEKIEIKTFKNVSSWLSDENGLTGAVLEDSRDGSKENIDCTGAFIAIGHKPITKFLEGQLETDSSGYILHKENTMTSKDGVFAAGDVVDTRYRQALSLIHI